MSSRVHIGIWIMDFLWKSGLLRTVSKVKSGVFQSECSRYKPISLAPRKKEVMVYVAAHLLAGLRQACFDNIAVLLVSIRIRRTKHWLGRAFSFWRWTERMSAEGRCDRGQHGWGMCSKERLAWVQVAAVANRLGSTIVVYRGCVLNFPLSPYSPTWASS